jgi:hypothetical protein
MPQPPSPIVATFKTNFFFWEAMSFAFISFGAFFSIVVGDSPGGEWIHFDAW